MRGGCGLYGIPPPGGIADVLDSLTVTSTCSINKKIYHKTVKQTIVSFFLCMKLLLLIIKSSSRVLLSASRSSGRLCNKSQVQAEKKGQEVTRELWDCSHIKCDIRFQGNVIYSLCVERQGRFVKGWTAAESTQHLKKSESKMPPSFFYRPAQRNKFESLSFGEKMIRASTKPNTAKKTFLILASSSVRFIDSMAPRRCRFSPMYCCSSLLGWHPPR